MGLALSLTAVACFPKKAPPKDGVSQVESEGHDDDTRFDHTAPLPAPEALAPDAPAASYLVAVEGLVQPAWSSFLEDCRLRLPADHPLNQPSLSVLVELTITGEGALTGVRTIEASGNGEFDLVATEVAQDTTRFPEVEPEWISDDGHLYLQWRFSRDQRQAGAKTARIRVVEGPLPTALPKLIAAKRFETALRRLKNQAPEVGDEIDELARSLATAEAEAAIGSEDAATKGAALRLSSRLPVPGRIVALSAELGGTERELSLVAIDGLRRIGSPEAIEHLQRVVGGEVLVEPGALAAATKALVELGKDGGNLASLSGDLAGSDEAKRWRALALLSQLVEPSTVSALGKLMNAGASSEERLAAAVALGRQAKESNAARKLLVKGLESKDSSIRAACAQAIGEAARAGVKNRIAYWKLVDMLRDKDERVRAASIEAAARLEPSRFAKELPRIKARDSLDLQRALAAALPLLPGKEATERLGKLLSSPDREVRLAAARSLAALPGGKGSDRLRQLIGDGDEEIQQLVVRHAATEADLEPLLDSPSPQVQRAALEQLSRARGPQAMAQAALARIQTTATQAERLAWYQAWLGN